MSQAANMPETAEEMAGRWCLRLSEGELSREESETFEGWLNADVVHRAAFDDAVRVWRALEETSLHPGVIALRQAALENFRRTSSQRWQDGSRRKFAWSAMAAALVAMLAAAGFWYQQQPDIYRTGIGERRVVVLADGSKVSLDAQTEVDVRYTTDKRQLRLDYGRAKFDVAKNPIRPFTVAAADKIVVATGTAFSVERLGDTVQVILYEGHVAVLSESGASTNVEPVRLARVRSKPVLAESMLTPGRELIASLAAPTAQVMKVDPVRTLAWEGGQLVFVDEPLAIAVARVNRYSESKVTIVDSKAAALLVNGVFTAGDTAAFVDGMTGVLPLKAEIANGRTVLASIPANPGR